MTLAALIRGDSNIHHEQAATAIHAISATERAKEPTIARVAEVAIARPQERKTVVVNCSKNSNYSSSKPSDAQMVGSGGDGLALAMTELPRWCQPDCSFLENIENHGPGCIKPLPDGGQEWRALIRLSHCPAPRDRK